jgi:hypothetical protein
VDNESPKPGGDFADAFTDETRFGAVWALLWLVMKPERHAVALALVGDKSHDEVGGEAIKRWAEPQLVAFRRDKNVPPIPWPRVAKILRHLPCNQG